MPLFTFLLECCGLVVAQIVSTFQALQEGHQRKITRVIMAQLKNCLWNSILINRTQ